MATKLYNKHLSTIIEKCREYYVLDTYIALAHLSSECKNTFVIQNNSSKKADLVNLVKQNIKVSYRTICNCINKLIDLNILKYNEELFSWQLVDMEKMYMQKLDNDKNENLYTGYTLIRDFFFNEDFFNMKAREKRLIVFMAQLRDSKASVNYSEFNIDLLRYKSKWLKVLKTTSHYYARNKISAFIHKYSKIIVDNTDEMRNRKGDLSPERRKKFKFSFKCDVVEKPISDNKDFDLVTLLNPSEYEMVLHKIKFAGITLSKTQIMHLVRALANISKKQWFLKERVAQIIINKYISIQKYKNGNKIKSLPGYIAAVIKSVVEDYKEFSLHVLSLHKYIPSYEIGVAYLDKEYDYVVLDKSIQNAYNAF